MDLYLIRHGETPPSSAETYNPEKRTADPPLTQRGIEQAELLGERLSGVRFDRIVSSDLRRTMDTASYLAKWQHCVVELDARFREIDMGELFIRPWSDFPEFREAFNRHEEDLPYPSGECGADVWRRCKPAIDEILSGEIERAAIVCHGGVIRAIVSGALGLPQELRFRFGCPPANCSITIVRYVRGIAHLQTFNDFAHVERLP